MLVLAEQIETLATVAARDWPMRYTPVPTISRIEIQETMLPTRMISNVLVVRSKASWAPMPGCRYKNVVEPTSGPPQKSG